MGIKNTASFAVLKRKSNYSDLVCFLGKLIKITDIYAYIMFKK